MAECFLIRFSVYEVNAQLSHFGHESDSKHCTEAETTEFKTESSVSEPATAETVHIQHTAKMPENVPGKVLQRVFTLACIYCVFLGMII